MKTERPDSGDDSQRTNMRILAIVGLCIGIGLLVFGAPAGFPPLAGPAGVGLCVLLAAACLMFGLIRLTDGLRMCRGREQSPVDADVKSNQEFCRGVEAKLRQLLRLKEEKLITEEEYNRKRADILEKW